MRSDAANLGKKFRMSCSAGILRAFVANEGLVALRKLEHMGSQRALESSFGTFDRFVVNWGRSEPWYNQHDTLYLKQKDELTYLDVMEVPKTYQETESGPQDSWMHTLLQSHIDDGMFRDSSRIFQCEEHASRWSYPFWDRKTLDDIANNSLPTTAEMVRVSDVHVFTDDVEIYTGFRSSVHMCTCKTSEWVTWDLVGRILPAHTSPNSHPAVLTAVRALEQAIGGLAKYINGTAVSIGVQSLHEEASLVEPHHTSPVLDPRGASEINALAVYRIGSVSKVFTVLTTLNTCGLRMTRASHVGGIDLDCDLASFPVDWAELGLPPARNVWAVGLSGILPCDTPEYWDSFGKREPVFAPATSPLYSNITFVILNSVIELASNIPFSDFAQRHIPDPSGISSATYTKLDGKVGVINLDTIWNSTLGIMDPAGGFYSNTMDFLVFGISTLTSELLSPVQTPRWLKPITLTSSAGMFIGAPWVIIRAANVTSDKHLIKFYTKGGGRPSPRSAAAILADRDGISSRHRGRVRGHVGEATDSVLTRVTDEEGPRLNVAEWRVRCTDVPAQWLNYLSAPSSSLPKVNLSTRLYPSRLAAGSKTVWRVAVDLGSLEELAQVDAQLFGCQASCSAWGLMDRPVYESNSLDEMVFNLDTMAPGSPAAKCRAGRVSDNATESQEWLRILRS
ncbi:hypothetical protein DL763_007374 [Monosporascus cannonballus]|nr:hypothetical protein DL763_007374 [Monosporascus cannonballus]